MLKQNLIMIATLLLSQFASYECVYSKQIACFVYELYSHVSYQCPVQ